MTAAGVIGRAVEKNQPPDFHLFFLAAMALVAVEIGWALHLDGESLKAFSSAVARDRPDLVWVTGPSSFVVSLVLGVIGGLIVALLFSNQHAVRPRYAWVGFAIWGFAMTGTNLWSSTWSVGGYADRAGAAWYDRHGMIDRQPWSAAKEIIVGCDRGQKRSRYRLRYDVVFLGRKARLATRGNVHDVSAWLRDVRPIDAAIPADVKFTRLSFDWRCIAYHSGELSLEEDKALVTLFRPTQERARLIEEQSPVWGQFIGQVAAEQAAKANR